MLNQGKMMKKMIVILIALIPFIVVNAAASSSSLIAWSFDGTLIATANQNILSVFNYPTMKQRSFYEFESPISFLVWDNNNNIILGISGEIIVTDFNFEQNFVFDVNPLTEYIPDISDMKLNSNNYLAIAYAYPDSATAIGLFDVSTLNFDSFLPINEIGNVLSLAWSPNGDALIASGMEKTIIFNLINYEETFISSYYFHSLDWSPDGSKILGGGTDGIVIWDAHTGEELFKDTSFLSPASHSLITLVRWDTTGRQFAAALSVGDIQIYDATTYDPHQTIITTPNGRFLFAWNPNGGEIAYVDSSGIQIVEIMPPHPTTAVPTTVLPPTPTQHP